MRLLRKAIRRISASTEQGRTVFEDFHLVDPADSPHRFPYFNKNYTLTDSETVFSLKNKLLSNPVVNSVEFLDPEYVSFHDHCPMNLVMKRDFLLCINENQYLAYITTNLDYAGLLQGHKGIDCSPIKNLVFDTNYGAVSRHFIKNFVAFLLIEMEHEKDEDDRKDMLKNAIEEKIYRDALFFEKKRRFYDKLISKIEAKIEVGKKFERDLAAKLDKKAKLPLNILTVVVSLQILFTQYGSYIGYSWDIIEPLVCFFSSIDIFFAYLYWYLFGTQFNYEQYYKKRREKKMMKDPGFKAIHDRRYADILKTIKLKRSLFSSDMLELIECFSSDLDDIKNDNVDGSND